MRIMMMVVLALACIWDGFTTLFGTNQILDNSIASLVVSTIFALVILVFLLSTSFILEKSSSEVIGIVLKILLPLAIMYDLYTSYVGNLHFIMGGSASLSQIIILVGLTLFVSSSPILISLLLKLEN